MLLRGSRPYDHDRALLPMPACFGGGYPDLALHFASRFLLTYT